MDTAANKNRRSLRESCRTLQRDIEARGTRSVRDVEVWNRAQQVIQDLTAMGIECPEKPVKRAPGRNPIDEEAMESLIQTVRQQLRTEATTLF